MYVQAHMKEDIETLPFVVLIKGPYVVQPR